MNICSKKGLKRIGPQASGFTVVEVIMSTVVAGLVIIALSTLIVSLNSMNAQVRAVNSAHSIVEGKFEDIRNRKFNALPAPGTMEDFTDELPVVMSEPRSATVTYVANDISSIRVEIELEFTVNNQSRTFDYATIVGELGVGQY